MQMFKKIAAENDIDRFGLHSPSMANVLRDDIHIRGRLRSRHRIQIQGELLCSLNIVNEFAITRADIEYGIRRTYPLLKVRSSKEPPDTVPLLLYLLKAMGVNCSEVFNHRLANIITVRSERVWENVCGAQFSIVGAVIDQTRPNYISVNDGNQRWMRFRPSSKMETCFREGPLPPGEGAA